MPSTNIAQGSRTVIQMADYLTHLKHASREFDQTFNATGRGYFDATEDELTQGLLVSYCQTRSALREIIDEMMWPTDDAEESNCRFLVGFAAALLLVDAACHMRSLVRGRAVVRQKFNQPVPAFGLDGGTYDEVQASLLSARNGWRLRQAQRFYLTNEDTLRQSANHHELEAVREVIETLIHRLDITQRRFFWLKLRNIGDSVLRSLGRNLFQRSMYSLQRLGSSRMADVYVKLGHEPALPEPIRAQVLDLAQPGDVFVVRKEFALTNYFLPGYWPHAALYLGNAHELQAMGIADEPFVAPRWSSLEGVGRPAVLESMKDGVLIRSVDSPFASDSIVVIRPTLERPQVSQAVARVMRHVGKPYDFDFDFGRSDRLVCTEVVYRAYEGIGTVAFNLIRRAGRPTLSGPDLLQMARERQHFHPVACYLGTYSDRVVTDKEVDTVLDRFGNS